MSKIVLGSMLLIGAVALADVAAAEVMDKEPTLFVTWAWALVGGGIGLLGWYSRWWAGAAAALLPAAYFVALQQELTDPYVGPAIRREAGYGYVLWSYCAVAVFFALHAAGLWQTVRRWLRVPNEDSAREI